MIQDEKLLFSDQKSKIFDTISTLNFIHVFVFHLIKTKKATNLHFHRFYWCHKKDIWCNLWFWNVTHWQKKKKSLGAFLQKHEKITEMVKKKKSPFSPIKCCFWKLHLFYFVFIVYHFYLVRFLWFGKSFIFLTC